MRRFFLLAILLLTGCASIPSTPQGTGPQPGSTFTPIPTLTPIPSTSTPEAGPPQTQAGAGEISFDFVEQMCNARWTNSGRDIVCPTDLASDQFADGYVDLTDPRGLNLKEGARVLVTYPAQNEFAGIFGRYPAYRVNADDQFHAHLGCMATFPCDVEFSLEYYGPDGKYHDGYARWNYHGGEPMIEAISDLTPLAGQRVEFVLVVRPQSQRESAWAVWVEPKLVMGQP